MKQLNDQKQDNARDEVHKTNNIGHKIFTMSQKIFIYLRLWVGEAAAAAGRCRQPRVCAAAGRRGRGCSSRPCARAEVRRGFDCFYGLHFQPSAEWASCDWKRSFCTGLF